MNRMDRAVYGTNFWISAPDKLVTLHKCIHVEQLERIPSPVGAQDSQPVLYCFAFR